MTLDAIVWFPNEQSPTPLLPTLATYPFLGGHTANAHTSVATIHQDALVLRELHWAGITFGAATGLVVSYLLFVVSGPLGTNIVGQLAIQLLGFVAAGYVAGRFSLVHAVMAGRIASLILFFVVATVTIAAGANANLFGLLVLGLLSIVGGASGATWAEKRRAT